MRSASDVAGSVDVGDGEHHQAALVDAGRRQRLAVVPLHRVGLERERPSFELLVEVGRSTRDEAVQRTGRGVDRGHRRLLDVGREENAGDRSLSPHDGARGEDEGVHAVVEEVRTSVARLLLTDRGQESSATEQTTKGPMSNRPPPVARGSRCSS